MTEVNLPLIIGASAIDSINPCAFGVLIFLLSYLTQKFKDKKLILKNGLIYIFGVFITYIIAGILLLKIIQSLGQLTVWVYIGAGILILLAGLVEIKDYFFYGKGFSLQIFPGEAARIKKYVNKVGAKSSTAFFLGVFVALVELPCTGAVYLAILTLMSFTGLTTNYMVFLLIYNIIFVLPLIIILYFVYRGSSTDKFREWEMRNKKYMRLAVGILLVALGIWTISRVI